MILVSSCLLGLNTKYDGTTNTHPLICEYAKLGKYIPICPEQLGGLPTPRSPVEIINGSGEDVLFKGKNVCNQAGVDCTKEFIRGADEVRKIAKSFPIKAAILKERSPSCGSTQIYDGSFRHQVKSGQGVTAALLRKQGIPVYSEVEVTKELLEGLLNNC